MAVRRLSKTAKEFNIGITTIVEFLNKKGYEIEAKPNAKVSPEMYDIIFKEYNSDKGVKNESEKISLRRKERKHEDEIENDDILDDEIQEEVVLIKDTSISKDKEEKKKSTFKIVGKIDLDAGNEAKKEKKTEKKEEHHKNNTISEVIENKTEETIEEKIEEKTVEKTVEKIEETKDEPKKIEIKKEEQIKITEQKSVDNKIKEKQVAENKTEAENITKEKDEIEKIEGVKLKGKIDLSKLNQKTRPDKKSRKEREKERREEEQRRKAQKEENKIEAKQVPQKSNENNVVNNQMKEEKKEEDIFKTKVKQLSGPTVVGRIELPENKRNKPVASSNEKRKNKRKRKRITKDKDDKTQNTNKNQNQNQNQNKNQNQNQNKNTREQQNKRFKKRPGRFEQKKEVNQEDINKQIKETYAKLIAEKQKAKTSAKHRKVKRDQVEKKKQEEIELQEQEQKILKVTEFITANELASIIDSDINSIISTCMQLGMFVSINQRLDAETITLVAEEYGYDVEFISADIQEAINVEEDKEENMVERPPIVTVMGHVDHGKTSLLDFVRSANVIAGEAGGITQHIGAYKVKLNNGKYITFLDTPGHEAFTAMRARGAKVTDIVIIVVAADDDVMPQTIEAINHASAAGVPIIFAINKIDKPGANPDKIKTQLADMNYMVEEWGGKFQSMDISAKQGTNVNELLELVLLEAEMLELKADPKKRAEGTVIESSLDKGRGYVTTILVKSGTMQKGDVILAGSYTGRIKAMYNERGKLIEFAGPSEPALVLGLNGAAQAGDDFNILETEKEAREIANKRDQLKRKQSMMASKHITLDEIGRRIAIGNFQELNVIVKGDVDGSIEALADSLQKLSNEEIQVKIIHKAVGQISENDISLAAASNAIIVGFQVRPSANARKEAEKEGIDIRLYSVIYDAIGELKDAMEGMLSPEIKEEIIGSAEIREVFKISKVGTIAGCMVTEGKIIRTSNVRVIRDGIVVYTGDLGSLKRFKENVKEVKNGYECGLNIEKFNDIKVGDIVEAYENVEVKKTLS